MVQSYTVKNNKHKKWRNCLCMQHIGWIQITLRSRMKMFVSRLIWMKSIILEMSFTSPSYEQLTRLSSGWKVSAKLTNSPTTAVSIPILTNILLRTVTKVGVTEVGIHFVKIISRIVNMWPEHRWILILVITVHIVAITSEGETTVAMQKAGHLLMLHCITSEGETSVAMQKARHLLMLQCFIHNRWITETVWRR